MEKTEKNNDKNPEMQLFIDLNRKAKESLKDALEEYVSTKTMLDHKLLTEKYTAMHKAGAKLQQRIAEFVSKNSDEVSRLELSRRNAVFRCFGRHFDNWSFDIPPEDIDKYVWIEDFLDRMDNFYHEIHNKYEAIEAPIGATAYNNLRRKFSAILFCPELEVGGHATLVGTGFNSFRGNNRRLTLKLEPFPTGREVDLTVNAWDDTGIYFSIPNDIIVPFDARCYVCIGGYQESVPPPASLPSHKIKYQTVIQPFCKLYLYTHEIPESDWKINPAYKYNEPFTCSSPQLPDQYKLFANTYGYLDFDGVLTKVFDNSVFRLTEEIKKEIRRRLSYGAEAAIRLLEQVEDNPSSWSYEGSPYVENGCLKCNIRVKDDFYWDFTIQATFYIIVPQGYELPGWSTHSD